MKEMTANEVLELLKSENEVIIIDVREVAEVAAGKILGSINIPLGLLEFRMHELDKTKDYIIVCRSGARSATAVNFLDNYGYNVTNLISGMNAWLGEVA
ncbi:rhodanese-like domain-containing protein [Alkalihalobacterium alkalinitrilicum]|uniref:rhodanese-like domain-containing protein n=1 Tax=Alkalihalobacterium alkalinitrilicum TaxID=427920 RepID=UPI000995989E|nr:rhodanese-like domain-containing protein [Alkalihalobacterium alkalinitrilicum]